MIGMINLPSDSPIEFYATPSRRFDYSGLERPSALPSMSASPSKTSEDSTVVESESPAVTPLASLAALPSPSTREHYRQSLRLFTHRKRSTHGYCPDGRKCKDGRPVETTPPSQLWDQLLVRHMVNRFETEIESPAIQVDVQAQFRGMLARQVSMSNPDLASSSTLNDDNESTTSKWKRSTTRVAAKICSNCKRIIQHVASGSSSRQSRAGSTESDVINGVCDLISDPHYEHRTRSSTNSSSIAALAEYSLSAPTSILNLHLV